MNLLNTIIEISEAKEATGLNLISAKEIISENGSSYHELEEQTESKSHDIARQEAIKYFCSIGYKVYPYGIGVSGIYTLADFLAINNKRTVFVEVLSDSNIKIETLTKKSKLQDFAELCFVFFSGTKKSDEQKLIRLKQEVQSWADVLYCRLNGWSGNFIQGRYIHKATVAYNTTRKQGIVVKAVFERSGRKLVVALKFVTHLYQNPNNTVLHYPVMPRSYRYETIFLEVFQLIAKISKRKINYKSHKNDVTIRSIRQKSGLQMLGTDARIAIRMKSEYRGEEKIDEPYEWTYRPSTRDLPVDDFYGVYILEKTGPQGLHDLINALNVYGLTIKCDEQELVDAFIFLKKQPVSEGKE
jgi:hypothetical protein